MVDARPKPSTLAHPFRIGRLWIPSRVVLAPMSGITNSAYRLHLKRHGVALVFTELVSALGILHGNRRTGAYLEFDEEERPIGVQLFAARPDALADAARRVVESFRPPDLIDLNMACPVPKVMKTGAGAALLLAPATAEAAAKAVVRAMEPYGIGVTAKMRVVGEVKSPAATADLAVRLEQAGLSALTIHPRTPAQLYRGQADHTVTARVVEAVRIPVIASGDVDSVAAATRIRERTGAAAVMIARGARGNPWLAGSLLRGEDQPRPSLQEVVRDLLSLLDLTGEKMGSDRAARWIRKHVGWYLQRTVVPGRTVAELRTYSDTRRMAEAIRRLVDKAD